MHLMILWLMTEPFAAVLGVLMGVIHCRAVRVILDTPLSVFLTMFGYPPDYLHSDEMHKVLKTAEKRKATVRQAPRTQP